MKMPHSSTDIHQISCFRSTPMTKQDKIEVWLLSHQYLLVIKGHYIFFNEKMTSGRGRALISCLSLIEEKRQGSETSAKWTVTKDLPLPLKFLQNRIPHPLFPTRKNGSLFDSQPKVILSYWPGNLDNIQAIHTLPKVNEIWQWK